jgi:hypothetical protein
MADAEVVKAPAALRPSTENTPGTYPEYHRVWEDDRLDIVAIFGKYESSATTTSDAGIRVAPLVQRQRNLRPRPPARAGHGQLFGNSKPQTRPVGRQERSRREALSNEVSNLFRGVGADGPPPIG